MYLILGGIGMLLTIRGAYQYLFMSADKITAATIRYGNLYLYVDLSMYFALMVLVSLPLRRARAWGTRSLRWSPAVPS